MTDVRAPASPKLPDDLAVAESLHTDTAVERSSYHDVDLGAAEFELTDLGECRVHSSRWATTRWRRCVFSDCVIDESDLGNAVFVDCGWQRMAVTRSRLTGLDVSACTLQNLRFTGCALDLSNWRFAKVRNAVFEGCKLSGADFGSASMSDVRFVDCDLTGAEFREVRLDRARFEACTLDGIGGVTSLAGATIDPLDLIGLSHQLAEALGITIASSRSSVPE